MPIHVTSEIGPLRRVLLKRPGRELEHLSPETMEQLLFDDIPYLHRAQAEHDRFAELLRESGAERLVMGFPRNMDGTEGPRADLYREFAALLEQTTGMKPVLWDERRTTIEAHQILNEGNYHGKKRKNTVDAVAASLILEGYLAYLRNQKE